MLKKITIIILTLLILTAVGWGGFYFLKKGSNKKEIIPAPHVLKEIRIYQDQAVAPTFSMDSDSVWFANPAGKFFVSNLTSEITEFPIAPFSNPPLNGIMWSPVNSEFLAWSGTSLQPQFYYYNSAERFYLPLAKNVKSMDWLHNGRQVVWIWQNSDNQKQLLVLGNPDGTGYRVLKELLPNNYAVKVSPNGERFLLCSQKSDDKKVYLFDLKNNSYKAVIKEGNNTAARWLTNDQFVYVAEESTTKSLFYFDLSLDLGRKLVTGISGMNTVDFDDVGKKLYIAIPNPSNQGMEQIIFLDPVTGETGVYFENVPVLTSLSYKSGYILYIEKAGRSLYLIR